MLPERLGHYRVHERVGAGGMGEVYRAADTRLGRDVALKILPAAFADDPERLARFEQEARLLAALNHPNIAAIHGLEQAGGVRFLVLEMVPGQTLAERLRPGPLEAGEALAIGRQVAVALEEAHERGIIHRDLKPANIKIRPDGSVKVLDFGLAKAFTTGEASPGRLPDSPTMTYGATKDGLILGTVAYMSPEQARGKALDKRTDIWSFGCVLYEMLTGKMAFGGETVSDTIAGILQREPDLRTLPARVPPRVRDLLTRCLQKDPARRLRDIGDARLEIDDAIATPPAEAAGPTAAQGEARITWRHALRWPPIAGAVVVAGVAFLVGRSLPPPQPRGSEQVVLTHAARLTHDPGISEWPTWSPDGAMVAFASNRDGDFDIHVRRIDGGQEVNVTNEPGQDIQPAFSPDGRSIAFVSTRSSRTGLIKIGATFGFEFRTLGGDLWLAPALGGQPRRLARDANYPAWHEDGRRIAFMSGAEHHRTIEEVDVEDGSSRTLLSAEASSWEIIRLHYAPDGRWITFGTDRSQVFVMPSEGGKPTQIAEAAGHVWRPDGGGLYLIQRDLEGGGRLQFQAVDAATGGARGEAHTVGLMTGVLRDLAISRDGRLLAASEMEGAMHLTLLPLDRDGAGPAGPEQVLTDGQVIDRYPSFSPDGRRLVFTSDRLGLMQIWTFDLATRRMERVGLPGSDRGANIPLWSRDGRQIVVTRLQGGDAQSIWLAAIDGSQAEELLPAAFRQFSGPFSPDGRSVLVMSPTDGNVQVFELDLATRKMRQITTSPRNKDDGTWSPDGRYVAFIAAGGGAQQVWRVPAAGGEEEQLTTGYERMRHITYSPDGSWIYVQPSHRNIQRMPASGGPLRPVTTFPESGLFIEEPVLSPDGRHLAYARSHGGASLWLLTVGTEESP